MLRNNPKICTHFGQCGGCRFQDVDYAVQLREKEESCRKLLTLFRLDSVLKPIVPSPRPYYYRNKMEFSIAAEGGTPVCGLHHRKHKRRVIDLQECPIFSADAPLLLDAIKETVRESGLPPYDPRSHRGFWRTLVLREGKFTNRIMVDVVTSSEGEIDERELTKRILSLPTTGKIVSIVRTVNDRYSDAVVPERVRIVWGSDSLEEKIGELTFRIAPHSFFQVNPFILSAFYDEFKTLIRSDGRATVLDVFSGTGPLSLVLARQAAFVTGIEVDEPAVEQARANAGLNGIKNVEFLSGRAGKVLLAHRNDWRGSIDLAVVNPPRAGVGNKVIKRIKEIEPRFIVYSSCNPPLFFSEARAFSGGYVLISIQPFDFFPHTPHLEVLALFERR